MDKQNLSFEKKEKVLMSLFIVILASLSYARVFGIQDIFWDDNCWLLATYSSNNLGEFLNAGLLQLRREFMGVWMYFLLDLHKNTEYFYLVINSVNMITQVITPLFLFLFLKNLFKRKEEIAFIIAITTVVYPVDTLLPVFVGMAYRLGLMLSVVSFYFTERALEKDIRWMFLFFAMILSFIVQCAFIEGAVALEPARLFVIGYILANRENGRKGLIRKSLIIWIPFCFLTFPLVVYKLIWKPYGGYSGMYRGNPFFFLQWELHLKALSHFFFAKWVYFFKIVVTPKTSYVMSMWSGGLGLVGAVFSLYVLKKLSRKNDYLKSGKCFGIKFREQWKANKAVFLLGLLFLIPPVAMYEIYGRAPIFVGMQSRHGIIMEPGYALILGSLIYILYCSLSGYRGRLRTANICLAMFIGIGIFFNNFTLDLFIGNSRTKQEFWQAFTSRFPTLPPRATFLFDVETFTPAFNTEFSTWYHYQFPLNMLYANSTSPEDFKNYQAGVVSQWKDKGDVAAMFEGEFICHCGERSKFVNAEELTVVRYVKGNLYVNKEILEEFPNIRYRKLLNREIPAGPRTAEYPLRYKIKGFNN